MRVALAQIITGRDLAANLALVEDYARQAKAGGADLVVFPEATMRAFGNSLLDIAEPLDGPWATRVRAIAAEQDIVIVAGMFTPGTADRTAGRQGPQYPAGHRPRRGDQLRQDPPLRRLRFRRIGHRGGRHGPGHLPARRRDASASPPATTSAFPALFTEQRGPRRRREHRLRLLGIRPRQGRAVEAAGPRPRRGLHHRGPRLRPGRSGHARASKPRAPPPPASGTPSSCPPSATSSKSSTAPPACCSLTWTPPWSRKPAPNSRSWPTATSSSLAPAPIRRSLSLSPFNRSNAPPTH